MKWFQQLAQKLVWAHRVIVTDSSNPVLRLDNGITVDLTNNRLILEGDFALHVTGNLTLSADGEVTIVDKNSKLPADNSYSLEGMKVDGNTSGRSFSK
jgi:hypothetical protein